MKHATLLALAAAAALLAACGDSPYEEAAQPSNEVPASATASPTAYSQYAGSLAKSDTEDPLDVRKVTPPTSESDLPITF